MIRMFWLSTVLPHYIFWTIFSMLSYAIIGACACLHIFYGSFLPWIAIIGSLIIEALNFEPISSPLEISPNFVAAITLLPFFNTPCNILFLHLVIIIFFFLLIIWAIIHFPNQDSSSLITLFYFSVIFGGFDGMLTSTLGSLCTFASVAIDAAASPEIFAYFSIFTLHLLSVSCTIVELLINSMHSSLLCPTLPQRKHIEWRPLYSRLSLNPRT